MEKLAIAEITKELDPWKELKHSNSLIWELLTLIEHGDARLGQLVQEEWSLFILLQIFIPFREFLTSSASLPLSLLTY